MSKQQHEFEQAGGAAPEITWRATLLAVALPLAVSALLSRYWFGAPVGATGLAIDALLFAGLMAWLRLALRKRVSVYVIGAILALLFQLAHAIKISFFGMPILASDIGAGVALFHVLSGWRKLIVITAAGLLMALAAWALWPRRGGLRYLLAATAYVFLVVLVARVSPIFAPSGLGEDRVAVLGTYGGVVELLDSYAEFVKQSGSVPSAAEVRTALGAVTPLDFSASDGFRARNIHLVLLETLWDSRQLKAYSFSQDPWDPRFRDLWEQGKRSSVLVPGFGGATANAEFEALCGMPSSGGVVLFDGVVRNSLRCLPHVLREAGYLTVASHPYYADFWSRDHAYPLLGFERYRPISAFDLDDMDGGFLSDASTFRQVRSREVERVDRRPAFNYLVSLSSHYPYSRNHEARPTVVHVRPHVRLLEDYANATRYTTAAFMDYVEAVRAEDPDALIVAFGDHAPVLGNKPDPYAESGLSTQTGKAMPILARTPLLMIDGRQGAVSLGTVPLRFLPDLLLRHLGRGAPRLPIWAVDRQQSKDSKGSHEYRGYMLVVDKGRWLACADGNLACEEAKTFHQRLRVLRKDLIRGHQFSAFALGRGKPIAKQTMTVVHDHPECSLPVRLWGPQKVNLGEGFNVQPSGRSALWMALSTTGRGRPVVKIGTDVAKVTISGDFASVSFESPEFLKHAGKHAVLVICPNGGETQIGQLAVVAAQ